ncbi:hypothetical protein CRENPOLYSF1_1350002 [Crenothrix polyspora]|uniref:Uncharacterized protein n=1 Tax=Crenothrix polyspora TaxID=360316 RepID=A0A1R4H1M1_9GAMM|nr:hypothetical protein CRENPOLYSF1_1350002 [Crenothrix polyspora]
MTLHNAFSSYIKLKTENKNPYTIQWKTNNFHNEILLRYGMTTLK